MMTTEVLLLSLLRSFIEHGLHEFNGLLLIGSIRAIRVICVRLKSYPLVIRVPFKSSPFVIRGRLKIQVSWSFMILLECSIV